MSWNTRELLIRCLRALEPDVAAGRAEVWVVDNGSSDGSAQAAREVASWAHVLVPGENLGFGRAVNLVAANTDSEWLACANADVALEPGTLEALLKAGRDARLGCAAPRLVLPDGTTQHSVYPLPTVPFTLAFNLGVHRLSDRLADHLCLEGFWNAEREREVPWAIGAFLLIRRTAFEDVAGFDQRQWLYAEDLDLGWRLHARGWVTRYVPTARVRHESGAATAPAFGEQRMSRFMDATYAVLLRRRGRLRTATTALINVAGAAGRLIWMAPLASISERWRGRREQTRRWLRVHGRALRHLSTLLNDAH